MAITDKRVTGGNGISYTKETTNSIDWSALTNNTYFRNISDDIIYFKDNSGNIYHALTGSSTANISTSGSISASTMSATTFFGDGSRLTNVSLFKLVRHDFVSSGSIGNSYCGTAVAGTAESSAAWTIKRITVALDGTTVIGTATNVAWTARISATYS
jgi:hypothetical protein